MIKLKNYFFTFFCITALSYSSLAIAAMDSRGTEFMFAFPPNYNDSGNLSLFISSESDASGTVEIPGLSFVQPISIQANEVTQVTLPRNAQHTTANSIRSLGVRVITDQEVTVYGLNQFKYTTDAFLALPVDVLGLEYLNISYQGLGGYPSQMLVAGVYDGTEVTITPTVAATGRAAKIPFNITLNAGDSYLLQAISGDLTGTTVNATSPVAVMGAVKCVNVPVAVSACDHIVEMLPPVATWGQSFVTIPLATRRRGEVFRILASEDNTQIAINSVPVATLQRGQHHEIILTAPSEITADAPVLLAQYSPGQSFDGVISDPFMMLIPPSEQFLNAYNFTTLTQSVGFNNSFVNVMAPTSALDSMLLDNTPIDKTLFQPVGQTGFSSAQIALEPGSHNIRSLENFGIYVYGFGSFDSYGYPGGMSFDFINPRGDSYPPNARLELFGDYIIGYATDSEDINANKTLDEGEDINGNGIIDRRSEDLNGNGLLDDGEDLNGNGVLDRDTGIFRIELQNAVNLTLETSAFVPGSLGVDFVIRRTDPSLPASGYLRVVDGAGNATLLPVKFFNTPLLTDVRVISTFSNNQIELISTSFSVEPIRIETKNQKTEVEWQFDHFPSDQVQQLTYQLLLRNPVPGETRLVLHELELTYADVNGNPVSIFLGTRAVKVAPSALTLSVSTDKIRYRAGETVAIGSTIYNVGDTTDSTNFVVNIIDSSGVLVQQLTERNVTVAAQDALIINDTPFFIGNLATGNYQAIALLTDNQGNILRQAAAPFMIVTDSDMLIDLASMVYTQQPVFAPWDKVNITARIQNIASNSTVTDATAELRVKAPDGQFLLQEQLTIDQISPSALRHFNFQLDLNNARDGEYAIIWTVRDANHQILSTSLNSFRVERQLLQELIGSVTTNYSRVFHSDHNSCIFKVHNRGNQATKDMMFAYSLIHADTEALLSRQTINANINPGSELPWTLPFSATHQPYGGYLCVLEAEINGTWQVLASTSFEVQPPLVSTGITAGSRGRVLVLTDEARQCSTLEDIRTGFSFGADLQSSSRIEVRLRDENGVLLDTEIISAFEMLINNNRGQHADLAVRATASGEFEVRIATTAQGLGKRYRVEVDVRRNWLSRVEKSWSIDTSCDRPFTLNELWEDALLLGWKPWRHSDDLRDADPFGPLSGPDVQAQNEFIRTLLDSAGWDYTLVHNAEDFTREHRFGDYQSYLLLSERVQLPWQVQKEIREAVFAGRGLISAGAFDKRNLWLESALGVSVVGRHPWARGLTVRSSDISSAWNAPLPETDTVQAFFLKGASLIAEYSLQGDNQTSRWHWLEPGNFGLNDILRFKRNAATHHHYGSGQSLFFGFDLLLQASSDGLNGSYAALLLSAVQQVQPATLTALPYSVVPLDLHWYNERGAVTARSELQLPAGATLVVPGLFSEQQGRWQTTLPLPAQSRLTDRVYLQLGQGTEQQINLLTVTEDGTQHLVQATTSLSYAPASDQTLAATQAQLDALAWRYWYRLDYRSAWLKFKLAREALEAGHRRSGHDLLLLSADLLLAGHEHDVAAARQQLQRHIRLNGRQLATLP